MVSRTANRTARMPHRLRNVSLPQNWPAACDRDLDESTTGKEMGISHELSNQRGVGRARRPPASGLFLHELIDVMLDGLERRLQPFPRPNRPPPEKLRRKYRSQTSLMSTGPNIPGKRDFGQVCERSLVFAALFRYHWGYCRARPGRPEQRQRTEERDAGSEARARRQRRRADIG